MLCHCQNNFFNYQEIKMENNNLILSIFFIIEIEIMRQKSYLFFLYIFHINSSVQDGCDRERYNLQSADCRPDSLAIWEITKNTKYKKVNYFESLSLKEDCACGL